MTSGGSSATDSSARPMAARRRTSRGPSTSAFNARALLAAREKRRIGMRAAHLVDGRAGRLRRDRQDRRTVRAVPSGSSRAHVVTAILPIASLLGTRPVQVVAVGGSVRRDELTCVGPVAAATLARYRFDLAVIGAPGSSAQVGHHRADRGRGRGAARGIERTERVIVIADGSKVGAATPIVVARPAGPGRPRDGRRRRQSELLDFGSSAWRS